MESAYKPDSVFVRRFLYAANPDGRRAASSRPYLALLPAGFAPGRLATVRRELLPHDFTLTGRRAPDSKRQFSQRPRPNARRLIGGLFLLHFPSVARPRLPGALCSAKSGLSSPRRIERPPPGRLRLHYGATRTNGPIPGHRQVSLSAGLGPREIFRERIRRYERNCATDRFT